MIRSRKILLIEDDEALGDLIMKKLIEAGFAATWEKNGNDGLRRLKLLLPDLVLLDIILPGLSGKEILQVAQKDPELKRIPIIVVSNSGSSTEIKEILEQGAKDYLIKAQFHPADIVSRVQHLFVGEGNEKSTKTFHILITEDDEMLASLSMKAFERAGYHVSHASDGRECLKLLESGPLPDLLLLDIIMPDLNGFDVLRAMKREARLKNIPVVIFSNYAQEHDVDLARSLGAIEFLVKSKMTPKEVIERVGTILRS